MITTTLRTHQVQALKTTIDKIRNGTNGFALFMDMGTGKSLVSLAVADYLFENKKIHKVIIACPKSIMYQWKAEIHKHTDIPYDDVRIAHGTFNKRLHEFRFGTYILINFDGLKIPEMAYTILNYINNNSVLFILDESTFIKHYGTQRSKIAHLIGDKVAYKMIMSGSPITTGAENIFSQYRVSNSDIYGIKYWRFVYTYLDVQMTTFPGTQQFRKIVGIKHLAKYQDKFNEGCFIVKKEDCLDLPEKVFMPTREFELSSAHMTIYRRLAREAIIQLQDEELTFTHKLAVLAKLRQVVSGFVYTLKEDMNKKVGEEIVTRESNARLKELEGVLEELNPKEHKTIIIYAFTHEAHLISYVVEKKFGLRCASMREGFSASEQIERFKNREDTPILVGQIQRMSHGLDLAFADVMIHFSHYWSSDFRRQVFDRIHRIGQTRKCIYIDLAAKNTIDMSMLALHKRNIALGDYLVKSNAKDLVYGEGYNN